MTNNMAYSKIVILFSLFNFGFSFSLSKLSLNSQLVFRAVGKSANLGGQEAIESHLRKNVMLQRLSKSGGEIVPPVPTTLVSKNLRSSARKFHLKDPKTDQYLIVETNSMILKTVTSEEFDQTRQTEITWFTACNDFTTIENRENTNTNHFEICIAGLEEKRLFYDRSNGAFSFLSQKPTKNAILPMQLRLVKNEVTHIYEYAAMFCSKGYLKIKNFFLGIGRKETMFKIEEPMFFM
jgi:hypothetical protein